MLRTLLAILVAGTALAETVPFNRVTKTTPVNTNLIGAVIGEGLSLSDGVLSATGGAGGGLTTNDVQAIALTRAEAEAGFTEWVCDPAEIDGIRVVLVKAPGPSGSVTDYAWRPSDEVGGGMPKGDPSSVSLAWASEEWGGGVPLTATRARLRPTPEQEAVWDAKVDTSDLAPYARTDALGSAAYRNASDFATAADAALICQLITNRMIGITFDFSTVAGLYLAISNLVAAQGGTITNFPAIQ